MVCKAIAEAEARDPRLIILDCCPEWQQLVIEEAPKALYVVFPASSGEWMVQCVPPEVGSFAQRKPLPEAWAGKRGEALAKLTEVEDSIFCHIGRFIGGAVSKEGAIRLAELAVAE